MKKCSTSLGIRETQIKTIMSTTFTRMYKIKPKPKPNAMPSAHKDAEQMETHTLLVGMQNDTVHFGKQCNDFLQS